MNPHELLRAHIGALVTQGFAVDAVRQNLDLKGASELWGGPGTDDHPAWYFWLTTAPGAYRLRLVEAKVLRRSGKPAVRGVFSVKYYPSRSEPVFWSHSEREQALIAGEAFDDTNTPKLEALETVSEDLFSVGTIEFTRDVGCAQSFLKYTSLDRMRFSSPGYELEQGEPGHPETAAIVPPVRHVPAWDLGYPLFDAIVGLQAFLTRRTPKRIILSRQPGFEFVETPEGGFNPRDSERSALKSLLLTFFPEASGATSPLEATMAARHLADPWTPLLDTATGWSSGSGRRDDDRVAAACGCGCGHGTEAGCRSHAHEPRRLATFHSVTSGTVVWEVPLAFNELWWALADAEPSVNSMPCGCH